MAMEEILNANIFFVIASVATIILCVLLCIVLFHVIRILVSIRLLIKQIEVGRDLLKHDFANVRGMLTKGGLVSHLLGAFLGKTGKTRSRSRKYEDEE